MQFRKVKGYLLRFLTVSLAVLTVASVFTACGNATTQSGAYRRVKDFLLETGVLASNSRYELTWQSDAQAVILKSFDNGDIWSDILYEEFLNGGTSANGNSPICITVYNTQTLKTNTIRSYSELSENGSVICKKIENGIRVSYFFDKYKIAIPVDYTLCEDSLTVTVDSSKIMEDGSTYKLVSISLVPFLCSIENNAENGYLFVPTGSGALMYTAQTADGIKKYSGEVYGADATRQVLENFYDDEALRLPVFGVSGNSKGMLGIIKEGAGAAVVETQAANENLGYSNIYVTFYARGYDNFRSNSNAIKEKITTRFSENMSGDVFSVAYYPLHGEDADYNGMAKQYRKYLTENGMLKESGYTSSPYSVTLVGGTTVTKSFFGIPYKQLIALTDFSSAKEIIEDLNSSVGISPIVRMLGYGDNGLRAGKVAGGKKYQSVYGGKKQFNALQEFCKKEKIDLFVDSEIVYFSKSGAGFSLNSDTAKTAILKRISHNSLTPTRIEDKKNPYNVLSRADLQEALQLTLEKAEKYGNTAISFSSLGSVAYSDYSYAEYYNKNKIEEDITDILNTTKKKGYKVATASANGYAACASDVVFDTAVNNGHYTAFDEAIPFYQMVFHSYKAMYTTAANLSENIAKTVAQAAAYGMGIGFTLNENYVNESNDLDEYGYYGTVYADNRKQISNYVLENGFADIYNKICNSVLEEYILLENGVSASKYSNGDTIYVNHTSNSVDSPVGELNGYAFVMQ